jgi:hypothetical protein
MHCKTAEGGLPAGQCACAIARALLGRGHKSHLDAGDIRAIRLDENDAAEAGEKVGLPSDLPRYPAPY